jgi:hypothetical protein
MTCACEICIGERTFPRASGKINYSKGSFLNPLVLWVRSSEGQQMDSKTKVGFALQIENELRNVVGLMTSVPTASSIQGFRNVLRWSVDPSHPKLVNQKLNS